MNKKNKTRQGTVLRIPEGYSHVPVEQTVLELCVPQNDETGFPVRIVAEGNGFAVYHAFWHEEFDDLDAAVGNFPLELTSAERLNADPDR